MSIPAPPIDFNEPIPGGPFFSPLESNLSSNAGPLVVGDGLEVDYAAGIITAAGGSGVVSSIIAGTGISASPSTGIVTVTNTGVTSLIAGTGISVSSSTGDITITSTGGTVTNIATGAGLVGGPITTSGTISLGFSGAVAGSYAYPSITVDAYGRITTVANGVPPVTSITGDTPVQITGSVSTPNISIGSASTTEPGVVQLNNTTASTSTFQALTAAQGKILQDQIDALSFSSNLTFAGTIDASTSMMVTVTAEAAAVGFVIGSPLPTPDLTNRNFFVIVTVPGVMIPPGGTAQICHQGDWWLSSGTVWNFLDVGYNVAYASTTTPGVVQLATNAEVQAGAENSHAVVPSSLQSKLSDSVSLTSSTTIASSTAAKIAYDAAVAADAAASAAQTDASQALVDAAAAQTDASQALVDAATAQADATQALADAAAAQSTANAALPLAGGTMTGTITFEANQTFPVSGIQDGTLFQKGVLQLNNSTSSTSDTEAATPSAVKSAFDAAGAAQTDATQALSDANAAQIDATQALLDASNAQATADAALPLAGGSMLGTIFFDPTQTFDVNGIQDGTLTQKGVVQLEDSVNSNSTTTAATPNSVCQVNVIAVGAQADATQALSDAATAQTDATQALGDAAAAQFTANAALPKAGGSMSGVITFSSSQTFPVTGIQNGTLLQKGVVQLSDSVSSTSDTLAATPSAVKQAYDAGIAAQAVANAALPLAGGSMSGAITFAFGQTFPVSGIQDATTSQRGVTQLATDAETQAGICTNLAVTPAGLQSKVSDSVSTTCSTQIASSTAVCEAYTLAGAACTLASSACALADTAYNLADTKIPCSAFTATGDILVASAASTPTALNVGSDGAVLTACSACSEGVAWLAVTQCPGTITCIDTSSALTGGPITTSGTIGLATTTVTAGSYTYAALTVDACGRLTAASSGANPICKSEVLAKGDLIVGTGAGTICALSVAANGRVLTANAACPAGITWCTPTTGTVTSVVAGAGLSGGTITTTGTLTLNTACVIQPTIISGKGTLITGTAASTPTALAVGTNGYILTADSACASGLKWAAPTPTGVTCVDTGTGLTGGPVTSTGTIALADTAVTSGSYSYASLTVDAQGRLTAASSGTAPNTTVTAPITNSGSAAAPVIGVDTATTSQLGVVQVGTNIQVSSGVISVDDASTSVKGVSQLNNTTTSTAIDQALTAAQGKALQDQINSLTVAGGLTLAATFNASTGLIATVTVDGTAAGFTVGSNLPSPAAGNTNYFVIVTTAGSYSPPGGGGPYSAMQGDWFLSDGSSWTYLAVGPNPPSASTTAAGIVELATVAETQAGTSDTLAVTPASAAGTYIGCALVTAKGDLIAATASAAVSALPVGTTGQVLTACSACTTGLAWATPTTTTYSATKAVSSGSPVDLLSWSGGVRMGTLTVMGYEGTSNRIWANIIISANTGVGDSTVIASSAGSFGTFSVTAGGGGETILTFTPSTTITGVNFTYQYIAAFGSQPTAL